MDKIKPGDLVGYHLRGVPNFDKTLYKYVSIEKAKLILENKTLMLTNPKYFNDPLDCYEGLLNFKFNDSERRKMVHNVIKDFKFLPRAKRRKHTLEYLKGPSKIQDFLKTAILEMKEEVGVCCFSEVKDNILMWSHYANNHKGVCIGFKLPQNYNDKFVIFPVEYRQKITAVERGATLINALIHWVFTKAIDWSYEKEYRAVNINYNGIVEIEPSFITEVYFGCNITLEDKRDIKAILKNGLKHVKTFQFEIDNNTFGLAIKKK